MCVFRDRSLFFSRGGPAKCIFGMSKTTDPPFLSRVKNITPPPPHTHFPDYC